MDPTPAITQRIAQFEAMVRPGADPDNDMAWFSLGNAYRDAGRHADAARAYTRSYELNAAMSKAYQLAGQSLIDAGDPKSAARVLTQGYGIAADRGDRMPMKAIGELLATLGEPIPEIKPQVKPSIGPGTGIGAAGAGNARGAAGAELAGAFICRKTGRPGTRMARPPFRGAVGQWIGDNISMETWTAWIAQGTKVINELRLDLSRDDDAANYDKHMREYLGIDDELYAELTAARG